MKSLYPVVLVHGIMIKDYKYFRAFGRIEGVLKQEGHCVYTAKTDGFGAIESNAVQLKAHITQILIREKAEKVNIIAHSKGGLDAKYMIEFLGMEQKVASLTTICTPHRGARTASLILKLPKFITKFIAFWVDLAYRIFGDKHPNSLKVCEQLKERDTAGEAVGFSAEVYCQSYSTVLERGRDDVSLMLTRRFDKRENDGLVSVESAKFGNYRGHAVQGSVSHSQIIDFMLRKKRKRENVYKFFRELVADLAARGF